jgi:glycopeptide antibiotics resistance protein
MGYMVDPSPVVYLAFFILVYLLYLLSIFLLKKKTPIKSLFLAIFFIAYLICVMKYTFIPLSLNVDYPIPLTFDYFCNVIPFKNIILSLERHYWVQVYGNILLLLPFPMFILMISPLTKLKRALFITFITCIGIELIQLLIDLITKYPNKVADIDDIILNMFGALIGVLLLSWYRKFILIDAKRTYNSEELI